MVPGTPKNDNTSLNPRGHASGLKPLEESIGITVEIASPVPSKASITVL
jgi:hypothetical protein